MFYVSLVLLSLGVAGIAYFVISTVLNRKKRVTVGGRSNAPKSKSAQPQRYSSNDDYPMITHHQAESPKDAVSTILPNSASKEQPKGRKKYK